MARIRAEFTGTVLYRNSCAGNALVGFVRNFFGGLSVKVIVKLLRSLVGMKRPALVGANGLINEGALRSACISVHLCVLRHMQLSWLCQ